MSTRKRKRPTPPVTPPQPPTSSRLGWRGLVVLGLLAAAALAAYWVWRPHPQPVALQESPRKTLRVDPRTTFDTPYRNVRPDVRYVGDDACASCHRRHATTYRQHPMGRSLAPLTAASALERYDAPAFNQFDAGSLRYQVDRRGGQSVHRETVTA